MGLVLGGVAIDLHLHPEVIALCAGLIVGYEALIRRYGHLMHPRPGERAVTGRQRAAFIAGVAALWVASGSPIHDLAERYLYSAHMIQHLIQGFVVPPLLLLGIPEWMGELLLRPRGVRTVVRRLAAPLVAALLFNAALMLIHWPAVVDLMLASELWHGVAHVVLIATGLLMWLNIASPVPAVVPRLGPLQQLGYLFLQSVLPTIPATFLTFGETPLYRVYESFPRVWGISALEDMRIAGLIMKIGGGFLLWGIITVLFFRWAADEERRERGLPGPPAPRPSDLPTA